MISSETSKAYCLLMCSNTDQGPPSSSSILNDSFFRNAVTFEYEKPTVLGPTFDLGIGTAIKFK